MMCRCALSVKLHGLSAVLMLLVVGCGGGGDKFAGPFGQVTGKVTYEGKPIPEGSQVLFQGTQAGYTAIGTVNAAGEYTLQCDGKPDVPGLAYEVRIMPPGKVSAGGATGVADPAKMAKIEVKTDAPPFPAKYSVPNKVLTFTVKEGKNTADFVLMK